MASVFFLIAGCGIAGEKWEESAVIVPGACLAQMKGEADLLSREAAIQKTVAVCVTNNNVDGLFNVQRQISELERCPPPSVKDKEQLRETVSRSYLRLFQATQEIVLPADQYDRYIVRKKGYNIVKPMRHPEVARAIAFPSEETTLITNAVLRQELDQYRAAKTQMENNMRKNRMLESIRSHILGYYKWLGCGLSEGSNTQAIAQVRSQIKEFIKTEDDRNMILELLPKETHLESP